MELCLNLETTILDKFRGVLLQTEGKVIIIIKNKSLKFTFLQGNIWLVGTHCPPAIHFFVKITTFELLYFLEFAAVPYETLHFC